MKPIILPPITNQISTLLRLFPDLQLSHSPRYSYSKKDPNQNVLVVPDWKLLGHKYGSAAWRMLQSFNWLLTGTWNTKVYIDQAQATHIMRLTQSGLVPKKNTPFHFWDISVSKNVSKKNTRTGLGLVEGLTLMITNPEFTFGKSKKVINFTGSSVDVDGDKSVAFLSLGNIPRIGIRRDLHNEHQLYMQGELVEVEYFAE